MKCFDGTYLQGEAFPSLTTCEALSQHCYSSVTVHRDARVVSLGCWPTFSDVDDLKYAGNRCLRDARQTVCICNEALCNSIEIGDRLAAGGGEATPEGTVWQAVVVAAYFALAMLTVACLALAVWKECGSKRRSRRVGGGGGEGADTGGTDSHAVIAEDVAEGDAVLVLDEEEEDELGKTMDEEGERLAYGHLHYTKV